MNEPLTFTRAPQTDRGMPVRGFRVTLGVVPDFTRSGVTGMPITDVVDGGPAAEAGLKGGDIIIKLADKKIGDIYEYMQILGELKPGQEINAVVQRDGEELIFKLLLKRR